MVEQYVLFTKASRTLMIKPKFSIKKDYLESGSWKNSGNHANVTAIAKLNTLLALKSQSFRP